MGGKPHFLKILPPRGGCEGREGPKRRLVVPTGVWGLEEKKGAVGFLRGFLVVPHNLGCQNKGKK